MQVAIDNISELEKKINIVLSTKEIDEAYDKKIDELSTQAHLEGFRVGQGKRQNKNVRKRALQLRYGNSIREEVLQELMEKSFQDTISENKFKIIGTPDLDIKQREKGKDVEYSVAFEVMPDINFDKINKDNFSIEKNIVEVTDEDVKFAIEKVLKDSGKFEEKDSKITAKSVVEAEIDFEVDLGEKTENGETVKKFAEQMRFDLADEDLKGFLFDVKKLLSGKKAEDEVTAEFTYPEDYFSKELAGKKATVKIKIKKVGEVKPAELNKEFYTRFGITEEAEQTEEALNKKVKEILEAESKKITQNKLYADFSEKLSTELDFPLPKIVLEGELGRVNNARASYCNIFKKNDDKVNITDAKAEEEATKSGKVTVIISRFAEDNNLAYTQENQKALDKKIQAKLYGLVDTNEMMYYSQMSEEGFKRYMDSLKDLAYNHIVLDELLSNVNVVEKKVSYKELTEQK